MIKSRRKCDFGGNFTFLPYLPTIERGAAPTGPLTASRSSPAGRAFIPKPRVAEAGGAAGSSRGRAPRLYYNSSAIVCKLPTKANRCIPVA